MSSKQVFCMMWGVVAALALTTQPLCAQPYRHRGPHPGHFGPHYRHYHYYPRLGFTVDVLPAGYLAVRYFHDRYFFAGGVWYVARGPRFVVVAAPVGAFVPVLPPYYTTVWIGGFPYYYVNDTYYEWDSAQNAYEVVAPPDGAAPPEEGAAPPPEPAPASSDLFVYPKNGQSPQQEANDKYECHKWAVSQSGFDPTVPGGGVPPDQNAVRRHEYRRADIACLVGRGYSVN